MGRRSPHLPYGPGAVVPREPYLGVSLCAASSWALEARSSWDNAPWEAIQKDTLQNAIARLQADKETLVGTTCWGLRAACWRTYMPLLMRSPKHLQASFG